MRMLAPHQKKLCFASQETPLGGVADFAGVLHSMTLGTRMC